MTIVTSTQPILTRTISCYTPGPLQLYENFAIPNFCPIWRFNRFQNRRNVCLIYFQYKPGFVNMVNAHAQYQFFGSNLNQHRFAIYLPIWRDFGIVHISQGGQFITIIGNNFQNIKHNFIESINLILVLYLHIYLSSTVLKIHVLMHIIMFPIQN